MKSRIIIAAGGTFGHIRPALTLKSACEDLNLSPEFYCTSKDKQFQAVRLQNRVKYLRMKGLPRCKNPFKILAFLYFLGVALLKVGSSFLFKRPKLVIGCGGFVSFPILFWAYLLRVPYILLEQNSLAGVVSRIFSKKARIVCLSMPMIKDSYLKGSHTVLTGNPIKVESYKKEESIKILDFTDKKEFFNKKIVGVMGGSLGAVALNEWVIKQMDAIKALDLHCLLVTGKKHYDLFKGYEKDYNQLMVLEFVENMGAFYSLSDYMISRAGASSISELLLFNKPTIFIPYPFASDNHQYFNAQYALEKIPSLIIEEKDLNNINLKEPLQTLMNLKPQVPDTPTPNATESILNYIKELL